MYNYLEKMAFFVCVYICTCVCMDSNLDNPHEQFTFAVVCIQKLIDKTVRNVSGGRGKRVKNC